MNKKAMRKDFYMEIGKSLGRFLSIFFIVALGVAFFAGIRSAEPDIRATADEYFDERKLMDIRVMGTLGITREDIKAVEAIEGIKKVEAGYSVDAICMIEDRQKVLHVMSLQETMNQPDVLEGRLPENSKECFLDITFLEQYMLKIGDTITLAGGNETDIKETLNNTVYTIVGAGSSPFYIEFNRGSSMIGTGDISGFVFLQPEAFQVEVYTELYALAEQAQGQIAFTDGYDKIIEQVEEEVEGIAEFRCIARKEEIVTAANEELDEAKKEYEEGKITAQTELAQAAQTIADGESQLKDGKAKVEAGKAAVSIGKNTLRDKQAELEQGNKEYESGKQQLSTAKKQLEVKEAEFLQQKITAEQGLSQGESQITQARETLDYSWVQYTIGEEGLGQLDVAIAALNAQIDECNALEEPPLEQIAQLENQRNVLQEQRDTSAIQLDTAKVELDKGELQYTEQKTAFDQQKATVTAQLEQGEQALTAGKTQLKESEQQLTQAGSTLRNGESQIAAGWAEIQLREQELENASAQIGSKEQELNSGKTAFQENKKKAEEQIQEGAAEIATAETQIQEIATPKWYVGNRSVLPEHSSYGDNADRIGAIGKVFPVLFFLVAALISLTTMTRMVEEQRTQIGTLKALGYSKGAIAGKYLGYAFCATLGGSILGILVGQKLLPYIIINAYGIMYQYIPNKVIPYNLEYAFLSAAAAILCTMAATFIACYKELSEQPASLMRPPSPKQGKRVIIERISWFWRHLSFTWKATIRNLIRYKKRFFMTVFGIGGCMALTLVGFGLKDSILDVATLQYDHLQNYEGTAYLKENYTAEEKDALLNSLNNMNEVDAYTESHMKKVSLVNKRLEKDAYMMVLNTQDTLSDYFTFRERGSKEEFPLSEEGAILTEKMAKLLDVEVGDTIQAHIDGNDISIKIVQVTEHYLYHYIYISTTYFEQLTGGNANINSILLKTPNLSNAQIEAIGEKLLTEEVVLNVAYTNNLKDTLSDMLKSLDQVLVVLIISAGMLAFVVLYNLNNINITERKRELATIKVLGFYDLELAEYVYRENIVLTLIGTLAGMAMGFVLHRFVIVTVEVDEMMFARIISSTSYLISIAFTIGFSAFVNWVMFYKLRKIDMVESLKSVE